MYRRKAGGRYNKKSVVVDGIKFDSKIESVRYLDLKKLEKAGEISNLELQPVFILQKSCKILYGQKKKTQLMIKYVGDFRYAENGKVVVEDVKSSYTANDAQYKIKKKLLIYQQEFNQFDIFREYIVYNKSKHEVCDTRRIVE